MNNITFKVAPAGEGKTKWLVSAAKEMNDSGHAISFFTKNEKTYLKFCDKYFKTYGEACPCVMLSNLNAVVSQDVVLIDNLLDLTVSMDDVKYLQSVSNKLLVTIEGSTSYSDEGDKNQLRFLSDINDDGTLS